MCDLWSSSEILKMLTFVDVTYTQTGDNVIKVKRHNDGKIIKADDLVNDNPKDSDKITAYLRDIDRVDEDDRS
jgi:hypothetical protein